MIRAPAEQAGSLKMIADVLNTPLAELGELALASTSPKSFNTIPVLIRKSDAIHYLRQGRAKAGYHVRARKWSNRYQMPQPVEKSKHRERLFDYRAGHSDERGWWLN